MSTKAGSVEKDLLQMFFFNRHPPSQGGEPIETLVVFGSPVANVAARVFGYDLQVHASMTFHCKTYANAKMRPLMVQNGIEREEFVGRRQHVLAIAFRGA